jgi:hypothetical protein
MLLLILYDFHEVILQVHEMNPIVRVEVVTDKDIYAALINETFPSVSSMNIADDVVGWHNLTCFWRVQI